MAFCVLDLLVQVWYSLLYIIWSTVVRSTIHPPVTLVSLGAEPREATSAAPTCLLRI